MFGVYRFSGFGLGLGFRVWGLGFGVKALGFRVWGFRVWESGRAGFALKSLLEGLVEGTHEKKGAPQERLFFWSR